MRRVDKLERAIERKHDEQDRLLIKLERSEDGIEKLLTEIQDLESAVQHSVPGGANNEALRSELKEKSQEDFLADKQREIDDQKSRIEDLEKELADSAIVYTLQVNEFETENKALQGKLKGTNLVDPARFSAIYSSSFLHPSTLRRWLPVTFERCRLSQRGTPTARTQL